MSYLETLTRRAIRASIQPGGKLRLEPDWLIADDIRVMVREHRDELIAEITHMSEASPTTDGETVPVYRILYVATDLDSFEGDDPRYGYELDCSPVYRMLDGAYYAWLRSRMENAKKAHDAGRMDGETFEALRTRFNVVHAWAVQHIGEAGLRQAIRTTNVKSYVPPSESTYAAYRKAWDDVWAAFSGKIVATRDNRCSGASTAPPNGAGSGSNTVSSDAVAKIDAIREHAMALGWTEEGLYGNSGKHPFPYGDGHGVVRFLKMNREIGEVTAEAIEIVETHHRPDGTVTHTSLRHYNPHVRQPWRTISGQTQAG